MVCHLLATSGAIPGVCEAAVSPTHVCQREDGGQVSVEAVKWRWRLFRQKKPGAAKGLLRRLEQHPCLTGLQGGRETEAFPSNPPFFLFFFLVGFSKAGSNLSVWRQRVGWGAEGALPHRKLLNTDLHLSERRGTPNCAEPGKGLPQENSIFP